jgi:penicillin-binding protein 1A
VGITPRLIGGAWVGNDDQRVSLQARGEGSVMALPIFGEFLKKTYNNPATGVTQNEQFAVPDDAVVFSCSRDAYFGEGEVVTEIVEDEFFD